LDLQRGGTGASVLHMLWHSIGPGSRGRFLHGEVQQQMALLYERSSLALLDGEVGMCCHLAHGAEASVV